MNDLTQDDLDVLTAAFVEKSKMVFEEDPEEWQRHVIQMVIVDTWLTYGGTVSIEQWNER